MYIRTFIWSLHTFNHHHWKCGARQHEGMSILPRRSFRHVVQLRPASAHVRSNTIYYYTHQDSTSGSTSTRRTRRSTSFLERAVYAEHKRIRFPVSRKQFMLSDPRPYDD